MAAQLALFGDLLEQLEKGETRRGAGREVDKQPAPSTRGTRDDSGGSGVRQVFYTLGIADTPAAHERTRRLDAACEAQPLPAGIDSEEAEWLACGCPTPQVMRTLDRVQAELAALVGDGDVAAAVTYTSENAARATYGIGGLVVALEPVARALVESRKQPAPIEKLAAVTVERRPHSWRKWEGEAKNVGVCAVCGEKAGYSVNGERYCAAHEGDADRALRRTSRTEVQMKQSTKENFTERQKQVVRLIAAGRSFEEIGEQLGVSWRTAKAHADVVRVKLGVEKRRDIPAAYLAATGENPFPQQVAA